VRERTISILKNADRRRVKPWQVLYRNGENKRKSKFFATQEEADAYAQARRMEMERFGLRALNLSDTVREEAQRGSELLQPYGKSLLEAVRFYIGHLEKTKRSCPIEALVEKFLWDKQSQGVSSTHLYDLKKRLERFAQAFPGRIVNTFESDEIGDWIMGLRLEPQTKLNYRRVLHSFFAYAVRKKYADNNPVTSTPKVRVPDHEVVIYSPEDLLSLLSKADSAIIPYLALGAFAGIRRAELLRLKWEDVRFDTGHIFVGGHIAKTGSRRVIPIADNLREWLQPYVGRQGKIVTDPWKLRLLMEETCDKAGVRWKPNGLRHSFGTYRIAQTQDIGKTSIEMGNSPSVILKHYRHLVTVEQAEVYWNIRPKVEEQLISLPAAA